MSEISALCTRCHRTPRPQGQRWCAACRSAARREARVAQREREQAPVHPNPEDVHMDGEQPSGWALGLADRVLHAPDAPLLKGRRPGRQVPDDWRERFLQHHAEHGVRWRGARFAGVSYDALQAAERADPDFARQVEAARQEYLDRHALNLNRLAFTRDNVVASIVALKAGRPDQYIERALTVTANFTATLDPAAGHQLLQALLGQGADLKALREGAPPPEAGIIPLLPADSTE